MAFTKINAAGIGSTETVTLDGLTVINDGSFGGNVSVGGTLTYEDVTNIDSVGLITARAGVVVGSGITLSKDGDGFFTGVTTATTFVGALTGTASGNTTISNNADNRVITGGSGNALNGESTLTYDGTNLDLGDSKKIRFGDGQDLTINHNGNHSFIQEVGTGNLYIQSSGGEVTLAKTSDFENMLRAIPDGAVELYYDNSKKFETTSSGVSVSGFTNLGGEVKFDNDTNSGLDIRFVPSTNSLDFIDNVKARFGTGNDIEIYHDGTNNVVKNTTTAELRFMYDTQYMLRCIPQGAVRIYYGNSTKAQTTNTGFMVNGNLELVDNDKLYLGASGDIEIYHDGTNNVFDHVSGSSTRFMHGSEKMLVMTPDSHVELYYDNSKKFNTTSTGTNIVGNVVINETGGTAGKGEIAFGESGRPFIEAFDNGNHGSGAGIDFRSGAGDYFLKMRQDAAVELYYDNVKKMETSSVGVTMNDTVITNGEIRPANDNDHSVGRSNRRYITYFGVNSPVNTSDKNEKNTIVDSDLGLDFINKLNPVSYKWNKDDGKTHYGLIVQDLEETLTSIGKTVSDFGGIYKEPNSPMGLSYSELISPLIKAVQELSAKNEALEARIAALEG